MATTMRWWLALERMPELIPRTTHRPDPAVTTTVTRVATLHTLGPGAYSACSLYCNPRGRARGGLWLRAAARSYARPSEADGDLAGHGGHIRTVSRASHCSTVYTLRRRYMASAVRHAAWPRPSAASRQSQRVVNWCATVTEFVTLFLKFSVTSLHQHDLLRRQHFTASARNVASARNIASATKPSSPAPLLP